MKWPVEKYKVLLRHTFSSTPPNTLTHKHTHTPEAVVVFDYEKQQDDELSLKVGDIITNVKQVREQYVNYIWSIMFHTTCLVA